MNRSRAFLHARESWIGDVPFLVGSYLETGRSEASFSSWLEHFRGSVRPEDDLAEYLKEFVGVDVRDLEQEIERAPEDLRVAVQEIWRQVHDKRRSRGLHDEIAIGRLAQHDLENYVGVLQRREHERGSPLGYRSWWLTLDSNAYSVQRKLQQDWDIRLRSSPVMSADFLLNYLAFGPSRRRLSASQEIQLPLSVDWSSIKYLTPVLLQEADKIREESRDVPEHIIRRRVRDHLDSAKSRLGSLAREGLGQFGREIGELDQD